MILVNSGAFLRISSWFCELTELIFVMIPYISSTGYPPPKKKPQGIMGHMQVANSGFDASHLLQLSTNLFLRVNGKQLINGSGDVYFYL